MTAEDVVLLRAVARAVLDSSRGDLAAQLEIPALPEAAVTIGPAPKMARADAGATFRRRPVARTCHPSRACSTSTGGEASSLRRARVRDHRGHRKTDARAVGQCHRDRGGGPARDGSRAAHHLGGQQPVESPDAVVERCGDGSADCRRVPARRAERPALVADRRSLRRGRAHDRFATGSATHATSRRPTSGGRR